MKHIHPIWVPKVMNNTVLEALNLGDLRGPDMYLEGRIGKDLEIFTNKPMGRDSSEELSIYAVYWN